LTACPADGVPMVYWQRGSIGERRDMDRGRAGAGAPRARSLHGEISFRPCACGTVQGVPRDGGHIRK